MANKYLHASGGTGNWSDGTGTWRTTDQGATITTAPTSSDVAIMTVNSGSRILTIDTTSACSALNCTGFTGTLTGSGQMTISGSITLSVGMTFLPSGNWIWGSGSTSGTFTMTTSRTFPADFTFGGTGSKVLTGGTLAVTGVTHTTGVHNFTTSDSSIIECKGGWDSGGSLSNYMNDAANNPAVYLQGGTITGTLPNTTTGCYFDGNITMAPASGGTYQTSIREGTNIQYLSGTTTMTDNWMYFVTFSGIINTGSNVQWHWPQWTTGTYTLQSDFNCDEMLTLTGSPTVNGIGYKVRIGSNLRSYNTCTWAGTFDGIEMLGTGKFADTTSYGGTSMDGAVQFNCNIILNSGEGTITFEPKTIYFGGVKTMTYVSGTVISTGIKFSVSNGNYFFDLNSAFSIPTLAIDTINYCGIKSDLTIDNLIMNYGTLAIYNTKTLTITTSISINGNKTSPITLYENTGSGTANLIYQGEIANCQIYEADITHIIASSSSVPIYNWYGTVNACTNISSVTGNNIKQTLGFACIS